jgi:hypothetical protein
VRSHALPPGQRRRRRRLKRGDPRQALITVLPTAFGLALYSNGRQEHASILYYLLSLLAVMAFMLAVASVGMAAERMAADSVRRRSRWLYVLLAIASCGPVALFVRLALDHARAHTLNEGGWEPMAAGMVATFSAIAGLFMLGRAIAWGRKRRMFWIYPPQWLDRELAIAAAGSGGRSEGRGK